VGSSPAGRATTPWPPESAFIARPVYQNGKLARVHFSSERGTLSLDPATGKLDLTEAKYGSQVRQLCHVELPGGSDLLLLGRQLRGDRRVLGHSRRGLPGLHCSALVTAGHLSAVCDLPWRDRPGLGDGVYDLALRPLRERLVPRPRVRKPAMRDGKRGQRRPALGHPLDLRKRRDPDVGVRPGQDRNGDRRALRLWLPARIAHLSDPSGVLGGPSELPVGHPLPTVCPRQEPGDDPAEAALRALRSGAGLRVGHLRGSGDRNGDDLVPSDCADGQCQPPPTCDPAVCERLRKPAGKPLCRVRPDDGKAVAAAGRFAPSTPSGSPPPPGTAYRTDGRHACLPSPFRTGSAVNRKEGTMAGAGLAPAAAPGAAALA
jgi:hypothetical protein